MNIVDQSYLSLLDDILSNGNKKNDRTNTGTLSLFGKRIEVDMSLGRFPLLTTKKLHTKSIIGELLWFLEGNTNAHYLKDKYGCSIWDEWADANGELGPVYGKQWVDWNGTNQISDALYDLKRNPDSRSIMVSAWNVSDLPKMALKPCHYGFQLYTLEMDFEERMTLALKKYGYAMSSEELDIMDVPRRKLSLMWNQRSVDTFLGLPFNIASYALLLEMLAMHANMASDRLIGNFGDVHLYLNHIEYAKEQLKRKPYDSPIMEIRKESNIFSHKLDGFILNEYNAHSNWKNVPIAV